MPRPRPQVPAALVVTLALLAMPTLASAQGRVAGSVHDSLFAKAPLAGARVILQGVTQDAISDRRGRFELRGVPAGTHTVTFFHPSLDSLGLSAPTYTVIVPEGGSADVRLAVPSFASVSNFLCGAPLDTTMSILLGRAHAAEDGRPIEGAEARAEWFELSLAPGEGLRRADRVARAVSNANGEFTLCGVPNDIELTVVVEQGTQQTGPIDLAPGARPIALLDASLSLTDPAARATRDEEGPAPEGLGRLTVTVLDEGGRPVRNAVVGVRGSPANGTTSADGRVLLRGVPSGTQSVVVRAIGRAPVTRQVAVVPGRDTPVAVRLSQAAALLPEIKVSGLRVDPIRAAFERRKRGGNGTFLEPEELAKRGGGSAALATVPGIWMQQDPRLGGPAMPRIRAGDGSTCTPDFIVDGMVRVRMEAWELNSILRAAHRVEVYTRRMLVPSEFAALSGCGAIVIWTM
jgi:hypothetical protein